MYFSGLNNVFNTKVTSESEYIFTPRLINERNKLIKMCKGYRNSSYLVSNDNVVYVYGAGLEEINSDYFKINLSNEKQFLTCDYFDKNNLFIKELIINNKSNIMVTYDSLEK